MKFILFSMVVLAAGFAKASKAVPIHIQIPADTPLYHWERSCPANGTLDWDMTQFFPLYAQVVSDWTCGHTEIYGVLILKDYSGADDVTGSYYLVPANNVVPLN